MTYRRYVVAVDAVGDASPPSNTLDIQQTVAPVAPAPPAGFDLLPGSVFELQTSAPPSGPAPVEVPYDPLEVAGDPADLRLMHYTAERLGGHHHVGRHGELGRPRRDLGLLLIRCHGACRDREYTITPSAGANGSITPETPQTVEHRLDSTTFTITADAGYHVADVLVDGASVGAVTSYKFTSVVADHTIYGQLRGSTPTPSRRRGVERHHLARLPVVAHGDDQTSSSSPTPTTTSSRRLVDGVSKVRSTATCSRT